MEKLSMCRICLEKDVQLNSIVETHLQEMYESLVLLPFETKDSRPILICYICCARLENCYKLRSCCIQSEELFSQMLSCDEVQPATLQEIANKKTLTVEHVVHLSMGHVLQMNADNIGVMPLPFDDVKPERSAPEDIDETALEHNSVCDVQSDFISVSDIVIVRDNSGYRTSNHTPREAVQRNLEDLTTSNVKEHKPVEDMSEELNKLSANNTAAKSTKEITCTLQDDNKKRSTSVPHSKRVQYTYI